MNIREYHHLQVERTAIEDLLERLPAQNVIERRSLEYRKKQVEEALGSQPEPIRQPAQVRLTFRGRPIAGTHGMRADFGVEAVQAFSNVVATVGASRHRSLGARGVIPNREDYELLITDTALGSFGFEMEENPRHDLFPDDSPVESAIAETKAILEATVGTDQVLTNAISETDPRALGALRAFLRVMVDHEAVCAVEFNDDVFQYVDVGQVRQCESRLREENIHEEETVITGSFQGVLPGRRTFEFQEDDTGEVISGRVDRAIADAAAINELLGKRLRIRVYSKRIGEAKPHYVLLEFDYRGDVSVGER